MNTPEAWAYNTLDKMSELWALVKGLNRTLGGECVRVLGLIDAELVRVWPVITAAQSKSEGMVREVIYDGCDSFSAKASSDAPVSFSRGSSDQAKVSFFV